MRYTEVKTRDVEKKINNETIKCFLYRQSTSFRWTQRGLIIHYVLGLIISARLLPTSVKYATNNYPIPMLRIRTFNYKSYIDVFKCRLVNYGLEIRSLRFDIIL